MRNTTTGKDFETRIEELLEDFSDHSFERQVNIGLKRNGRKHILDVLLNGEELISLKYQQVYGTAEEKIPFEFMKLQHAIDDYGYKSATIVIAGPDSAWKWKDYYLSNEFSSQMKQIYPDVNIMELKDFMKQYLIQDLNE